MIAHRDLQRIPRNETAFLTRLLGPGRTHRRLGSRHPLALVQVDLRKKQTAAGSDFLAINPKGYVPALELEGRQILTEASAVLQYLADRNPASDQCRATPGASRLPESTPAARGQGARRQCLPHRRHLHRGRRLPVRRRKLGDPTQAGPVRLSTPARLPSVGRRTPRRACSHEGRRPAQVAASVASLSRHSGTQRGPA